MNTQAEHTPGPWRFIKQRHHCRKAYQWVLDSNTRGGMAIMEVEDLSKWGLNRPDCVNDHAETIREVKANASLIAAAPELLSALVQASDTLSWAQNFMVHADKSAIPDTLSQIRAAIAKAEGRA